MLNGLDLFSGIGGLTLAIEPWARPIAYCENEPYAQSILLSRMADGLLPNAPIWDDVRTLDRETLGTVPIDIIYGGFPCQDISAAGHGQGMERGERSGLFFEIARLIQEIRPAFVFLENVPAIRTRGLSRVLSELTALRYDCRWTIISAAEIGAPHLRKRWFLLAADPAQIGKAVVDTMRERGGEGRPESEVRGWKSHPFLGGTGFEPEWWTAEPDICRVANGIQKRVDRLRGLGNAVVPSQAREAFMRLLYMKGGV